MQAREDAVGRALFPAERMLVEWLVSHGHSSARHLLASVKELRVRSESQHGSFSLHFENESVALGPDVILAEFAEHKDNGEMTTVTLLGSNGQLSSIEAWAAESERVPVLPSPEALRAIT